MVRTWAQLFDFASRTGYLTEKTNLVEVCFPLEEQAQDEFKKLHTAFTTTGSLIDSVETRNIVRFSENSEPQVYAVGHPNVPLGTVLRRTQLTSEHFVFPQRANRLLEEETRTLQSYGGFPNEDATITHVHKHYSCEIYPLRGWIHCELDIKSIPGGESRYRVAIDAVSDFAVPSSVQKEIARLKQL